MRPWIAFWIDISIFFSGNQFKCGKIFLQVLNITPSHIKTGAFCGAFFWKLGKYRISANFHCAMNIFKVLFNLGIINQEMKDSPVKPNINITIKLNWKRSGNIITKPLNLFTLYSFCINQQNSWVKQDISHSNVVFWTQFALGKPHFDNLKGIVSIPGVAFMIEPEQFYKF